MPKSEQGRSTVRHAVSYLRSIEPVLAYICSVVGKYHRRHLRRRPRVPHG